jgi:hypothetical protein
MKSHTCMLCEIHIKAAWDDRKESEDKHVSISVQSRSFFRCFSNVKLVIGSLQISCVQCFIYWQKIKTIVGNKLSSRKSELLDFNLKHMYSVKTRLNYGWSPTCTSADLLHPIYRTVEVGPKFKNLNATKCIIEITTSVLKCNIY